MKKTSIIISLAAFIVAASAALTTVVPPNKISAAQNKVELKMDAKAFYPDSSGNVKVTGQTTPGAKIKIGLIGYKNSGKNGKFSLAATSKKVDKKITVTAKHNGFTTIKKIVTIKKKGSVSPSQKAELKAINSALAEDLKQEQGWAKGTLDSNGNPTDNGTPNSAFSWTTYIKSVTIDPDYHVTAHASASVLTIAEKDKWQIAERVGKFSLATLIRINRASDKQVNAGSLFATVKVSKRIIATHY
jgi:hypothetical protein